MGDVCHEAGRGTCSDAEGDELAEVQAALGRLAASKRAAANKKQQAILQASHFPQALKEIPRMTRLLNFCPKVVDHPAKVQTVLLENLRLSHPIRMQLYVQQPIGSACTPLQAELAKCLIARFFDRLSGQFCGSSN